MIELVIEERRRDLGGFEVGRVLPFVHRRMVGPFVFFDHMGPAQMAPGIPRTVDVRPHPHIGLSTVTYLFSGEIMHRDSVASQQAIRAGEVNWMTAGSGITHSERFEKARAHGDLLHGIQAWVALPTEDEECAPAFAHHDGADLPSWSEHGAAMRLIAGEALGMHAAVQVHSPTLALHVELEAGGRSVVPGGDSERAIFVARGSIDVDGQRLPERAMAILSGNQNIAFTAAEPATVMIIGGEPVGPRFIDWNFVSSSKGRIETAKADWRAGRMKLPDFDHDEFIPLD